MSSYLRVNLVRALGFGEQITRTLSDVSGNPAPFFPERTSKLRIASVWAKQTRGGGTGSLRCPGGPAPTSRLGTSAGWLTHSAPETRAYLGRSAAGTGTGAPTGRPTTSRSRGSPRPLARGPPPAARPVGRR